MDHDYTSLLIPVDYDPPAPLPDVPRMAPGIRDRQLWIVARELLAAHQLTSDGLCTAHACQRDMNEWPCSTSWLAFRTLAQAARVEIR